MSRARSESSARRLSREVASTDAGYSRAVVADTLPKRTPARSSTISPPRLTASLRFPRPAPEFLCRCVRDKPASKHSWCSSTLSCAETAITRLSGTRSPRCIQSAANPSGGGATTTSGERRSSIGARRHGATSGARRGSDLSSSWRGKTASGKVSWKKGSSSPKRYPDFFPNMRPPHRSCTAIYGVEMQPFYSAYREAAPLDQGYAVRKTLYNLYHVLNHANLFGGGYAAQAERMIERLLAELR